MVAQYHAGWVFGIGAEFGVGGDFEVVETVEVGVEGDSEEAKNAAAAVLAAGYMKGKNQDIMKTRYSGGICNGMGGIAGRLQPAEVGVKKGTSESDTTQQAGPLNHRRRVREVKSDEIIGCRFLHAAFVASRSSD